MDTDGDYGPFRSFHECLTYRGAYIKASNVWATMAVRDQTTREDLAERLLAALPRGADRPTRMGTRDGALGSPPAC